MTRKMRNEEFLQNYATSWFKMNLSGKHFEPLMGRDIQGELNSPKTWEKIFNAAIEDLKNGNLINGKGEKNSIDYWGKQKELLDDFVRNQSMVLSEEIGNDTKVSLYRDVYDRLIVESKTENSRSRVWLENQEIAKLLHYGMFMLQEKGEIDFMNEKEFPDYYDMYHEDPEWDKNR